MGATTTAFKNLLKQLQADFPELHFAPGTRYYWSMRNKTVYFDEDDADNAPLLLHETAHGLLGHDSYGIDIELIALEREAWTRADELAKTYAVHIADNVREDSLDSYRDWLHTRSLCPHCTQSGLQTSGDEYQCVVCSAKWRVNDAKTCGLRRTIIN